MKHYDRETKKYVNEEIVDRKAKKRKLCKGGKPHDFILALPPNVQAKDSILGLDIAERYYKLNDKINDKQNELDADREKKLKALGIKVTYPRWRGYQDRTRYYICSVCKKGSYNRPSLIN